LDYQKDGKKKHVVKKIKKEIKEENGKKDEVPSPKRAERCIVRLFYWSRNCQGHR
jgi:hypothetical protein